MKKFNLAVFLCSLFLLVNFCKASDVDDIDAGIAKIGEDIKELDSLLRGEYHQKFYAFHLAKIQLNKLEIEEKQLIIKYLQSQVEVCSIARKLTVFNYLEDLKPQDLEAIEAIDKEYDSARKEPIGIYKEMDSKLQNLINRIAMHGLGEVDIKSTYERYIEHINASI